MSAAVKLPCLGDCGRRVRAKWCPDCLSEKLRRERSKRARRLHLKRRARAKERFR